jgi:glycosyltransferase involved in cell wall biosynthesis
MTQHQKREKKHCMIVFATYPLGETRVQREAEALIKAGYEVDVICCRTPGSLSVDQYKGVKIYREKYKGLLNFWKPGSLGEKLYQYLFFFMTSAYRITRLHFQKHYDSIQVHNLPDFLVFSTLVPKLFNVPIILDLHDLMPEFYASRFRSNQSALARVVRLQEKLSCQFADHVITVSEHWRQTLILRGVSAEKCTVVMNIADEGIFQPSNTVQVPLHNEEIFRLIYHGAMVERYGLDLILRAIHHVKNEISGIHLSLIGYGDFLPQMKSLVETLDLKQNVTFVDSILAEELTQAIRSCHLGVVPYRNDVFTDGLIPTKLLEYAALGMPAIASRTTTIESYFSNANVEFCKPDSVEDLARCIILLYRNPDRLIELAEGSKNFNQRYNWKNTSEIYVHLINQLSSNN